MKIPQSVSTEAKEKIIAHLSRIVEAAKATEKLLDKKASCEEIFRSFTNLKETTDEVESLLLTYQLENCLLPSLGHFEGVVEALNRLVKRKYGALLVIERISDLSPYIRTGTPIDALITAPLIESIFYPGNPLHDGAVIIRENRLAAAGCVLPLSQKTLFEHGQPMGMRHRSALGLTELTDALIIVVSEETQRISLALGSHLYRLKKTANLWANIHGATQGKPPASPLLV
ncbi:diadenylate cyclase [Phosphitispora fastidiosa]|uniref:diadenylate cyclase n=1 Tax=Phosphitispora fastidiosa TaxID=2837202 RepID=UPI001E45C72A|nr:diadenylate cyclase [Phosphitispora fastidiosa]MBU7006280.1 hypothetical protein [Phosphitispora fastidiosa]